MDTLRNDGILYEKIGRRYKPVRSIHAYEGLGTGCWLVRVDEGCTSIRHTVNPDNAAIEHACKIAEDKLVKILAKVGEAKIRRKTTPLTKREQKAIKAYYDVMGEERTLYFDYPSLYGMAEEILKELTNTNEKEKTVADA